MARIAAQARMMFYPIPPEAIDLLSLHLKLDTEEPKSDKHKFVMLDPCCGQGKAMAQLSSIMGMDAYGIELHESRAQDARDLMPHANILGPCSFHGTRIQTGSFGLAYVNPPFDDELGGGGREEDSFVHRATGLLCPGGVLVLVCPGEVALRYSLVTHLHQNYEHLELYPFPEKIRDYREVFVIGKKRAKPIAASYGNEWHGRGWSYIREDAIAKFPSIGSPLPVAWDRLGVPEAGRKAELDVWTVPRSAPPRFFVQSAYTDEQLSDVIERSAVNRLFDARAVKREVPRPGLPIGKGHASLFMVSGAHGSQCTLTEPSGKSFLLRGSSVKESYISKQETKANEKSVTTTVVTSQRGVPVIRCLREDGEHFVFDTRHNAEVIMEDEDEGSSEDE